MDCLLDNIKCEVGDGMSIFFWNDMWLNDASLDIIFSRLFELAKNKLAIVSYMHFIGWKWRRRSFTWEEELVRKCVDRSIHVVLQAKVADHWV